MALLARPTTIPQLTSALCALWASTARLRAWPPESTALREGTCLPPALVKRRVAFPARLVSSTVSLECSDAMPAKEAPTVKPLEPPAAPFAMLADTAPRLKTGQLLGSCLSFVQAEHGATSVAAAATRPAPLALLARRATAREPKAPPLAGCAARAPLHLQRGWASATSASPASMRTQRVPPAASNARVAPTAPWVHLCRYPASRAAIPMRPT